MDDILLTFDSNHSNIQKILDDFNSLRPKLLFTVETEKTTPWISWTKHTQNPDTHENRHIQKTHVYWYHNSLYLLPSHTPQVHDSQIPIQQTWHLQPATRGITIGAKHYLQHSTQFLSNKTTQPPHPQPSVKQVAPCLTQKWATYTYVGRVIFYITNIFRQTELKISFHTTNTLDNLLTHKHHPKDKLSL